jgi:Zn-dependent protease with chaperone function
MTTIGQASYFDGVTSARHDVTVTLGASALQIQTSNGDLMAEWPYNELESISAPRGLLRIGRINNTVLARLNVRDPSLAGAIDDLSVPIDRSGLTERRDRRKVVFWSLAATLSLLLVAIYGVPEIASRLTPLVPYTAEIKLGAAIDAQVRSTLDEDHAGPRFVCGTDAAESAGRAAFDKMFARLEQAAARPIPLRIAVVRSKEANAVTLPGGIIYVFHGLIDKAESADEVAGVIAHELGHVAHRDGTRTVLQQGAMSLLFGMLLGDFVGGGAVIVAAKAVLQTSYSRDVEAAADLYAVDLMKAIEADPRALGTILTRIAGSSHNSLKFLLDHPETKDRVDAINSHAGGGTVKPLLAPSEWAEMRRICSGSRG